MCEQQLKKPPSASQQTKPLYFLFKTSSFGTHPHYNSKKTQNQIIHITNISPYTTKLASKHHTLIFLIRYATSFGFHFFIFALSM